MREVVSRNIYLFSSVVKRKNSYFCHMSEMIDIGYVISIPICLDREL